MDSQKRHMMNQKHNKLLQLTWQYTTPLRFATHHRSTEFKRQQKEKEMATGKSQFTGTAGQFYVAYELSVREINAAITLGNAPGVDLMASLSNGKKTLSIQVKTSRNAYRKKRYGHEGFEWDVNKGVIGKHHESFWYAFVDLQENNETWNPKVFFVPSLWVANFVKPDWSRFMYFLPATAESLTLNRWDLFKGYLEGNTDSIKWANDWPEDKLVKWGTGAE